MDYTKPILFINSLPDDFIRIMFVLLAHVGIIFYIIYSAIHSKKKSLGLYKHIIIRISIFVMPSCIMNIYLLICNMLDDIDLSDEITFIFGGGFLFIFAIFTAIVLSLVYLAAVGILWIIFAVKYKANKRKSGELVFDNIITVINDGDDAIKEKVNADIISENNITEKY